LKIPAAALGLPDCANGAFFDSEPVPTDVEIGPDGHYYVTTLPGGPELPGFGQVVQVDPSTGGTTVVETGFSGAIDLAVADDGSIYVAEFFGGQVTKVNPDGSRESAAVACPSSVEIGKDGTVYVADAGICVPEGAPPLPGSIITLDL
jgi:sugar lactone lactonase YvrE